jgi:translation initiation factor IF-2
MACNRNHLLATDVISMLGEQFGIKVNIKTAEGIVEEKIQPKVKSGKKRWPIVVVMGHVDHGKTTLLDFVRKMNTAIREKGGITQHLGAYEVDSSHGKLVFLDTPGHEAFSFLRARGAKVTDIAILVVAADDGVKPQTIEAIEHAKKAGVPIVVAINKIDKVPSSAAVQTVKRQLAEHDLVVEDWGGDIVCVPISAKTGQGVEDLLEMIVLQSEMMDLRAEENIPARAFILESKLEKGLGPVATVICLEGVIKQGDYFVCGTGTGRVRLLVNSFGEKLPQVGPAIPVKVVGFDNFAEIGDWLTVSSKEKYSKAKSTKKTILPLAAGKAMQVGVPLAESSERQINLIIKTDTRGSKEAIEGSIFKLTRKVSKDCLPINIIQSGIGDISEGDIELADSTGALLLGLHIKAEKNAILLAKNKGVKIELFDIIYHMVEYLQELLEKSKKVEISWTKVAQLVVKKVFNIKKVGVVAGCGVLEGVVSKNNKVECLRGGKIIGEGRIVTLQKEGKVVQQVHSGYECGFTCDGFNEWQEGDLVNCYAQAKPAERK